MEASRPHFLTDRRAGLLIASLGAVLMGVSTSVSYVLPTALAAGVLFLFLVLYMPDVGLLMALVMALAIQMFPDNPYYVHHMEEYVSPWTRHILPKLNIFDCSFLILTIAYLPSLIMNRFRMRKSHLDKYVLAFALLLYPATVLGMATRGDTQPWGYLNADIKSLAYVFIVYFLVTRLLSARILSSERGFRIVFYGLLALISLRFFYALLKNTIFQSGGFVTAAGFSAIVMTEDSVLYVILITGFLSFAEARIWKRKVVLLVLPVAIGMFLVDLLSVRRGALLVITAAIIFQVMHFKTRSKIRYAGALLFLLLALWITISLAFPWAVPTFSRIFRSFVAGSGASEQVLIGQQTREAEARNVIANLQEYNGMIWGLGLGRAWKPFHPLPEEPWESYALGAGEREDWRRTLHIPLTDWLLRVGFLGVAILFGIVYFMLKSVRKAVSATESRLNKALLPPLYISFAGLSLFLLTNYRIDVVLGFLLGFMSIICDSERRKGEEV